MAASIYVRQGTVISAENSYTDHEPDANSALSELDKGLRSQKIGVQCESIVRFPRLFEKYPFPVLINSAVLKLADVFRAGNNFIRLCVLKVFQQSQKHLDKILNIDELVRRIQTVLHSNDPVARAITLRTLGSLAIIISEQKSIHHSIMVCLNSNDTVEVAAAVYASEHFSAKSKSFAVTICDRISEMLQRLDTPVELKLKLISTLQNMHHSADLSQKAIEICRNLISMYSVKSFVELTLCTMTKLTISSLLELTEQISVLLHHLHNDNRTCVKISALKNLKLLSRKVAHVWKVEHLEDLCMYMNKTPIVGIKIGIMDILVSLSNSVVLHHATTDKLALILEVCREYNYHENHMLASKSLQLMIQLAIYFSKADSSNITSETIAAVQTQIIMCNVNTDKKTLQPLKECFQTVGVFCQMVPCVCHEFVKTLSVMLDTISGPPAEILCQFLAKIGTINRISLEPLIPKILSIINKNSAQCGQVYLYILLFQAANGQELPTQCVRNLMDTSDLWNIYRIGRESMRFGQFHIGQQLFSFLKNKVAQEHFYFWLNSLSYICAAETKLQYKCYDHLKLLQNVTEFSTIQHNGLFSLKAAKTASFALNFQCRFIKLRLEMIQAHSQLIRSCNTIRSCPPPAIATAVAQSSGQEISRCGQIISQLTKCVNTYKKLSDEYAELYTNCFDADPLTLSYVQLLQQSCETMRLAIQCILQEDNKTIPTEGSLLSPSAAYVDSPLLNTLDLINQDLRDLKQKHAGIALTYVHVEFLSEAAKKLINIPFSFPRFFFQTLQDTSIKLAISPSQVNLEPVSLSVDALLQLKVEGVVQHGKKPGLFRNVSKVKTTVKSTLSSRSTAITEAKSQLNPPTTNYMENTETPHNDYFCSNFLLPFPVAGIHNISIEISVIDESGVIWQTGPKSTMTAKSYDEMYQRQQQQARFQQKLPQAPTPSF